VLRAFGPQANHAVSVEDDANEGLIVEKLTMEQLSRLSSLYI